MWKEVHVPNQSRPWKGLHEEPCSSILSYLFSVLENKISLISSCASFEIDAFGGKSTK